MTTVELTTIFRRSPLVQRPRPVGLPLRARILELKQLAQPVGGEITQAAEVCNKAALIASDCGLPDLARALCWRQYDVFAQARPLPITIAELALQPLLNLPRQLIREGNGADAYTILTTLLRATRDRSEATIAGRTINLGGLVATSQTYRKLCERVWAALLADGTRALALAGRWRQAAESAAAHRGIGRRLLDGRQITIIALAHEERTAHHAAVLTEESTTVEPWERTVQRLLRVLCQRAAGDRADDHTAAILTAVHALLGHERAPATATFRTRVGLAALDLAAHEDQTCLAPLQASLVDTASTDAYAARDVLSHRFLNASLSPAQHHSLADLVRSAGFDAGTMPEPFHSDLMAAVSSAENRLHALLHK